MPHPETQELEMRYHNTAKPTVAQANLNTALAWADAGFPVFPCRPDKRPLVKGWQNRATTDAATIRRWWRKHPDAMPGLPMGSRSGLAVLDLDRKNSKDGVAALRAMGLDPATLSPLTAETPSGGLHAYFRWPEGMGNSAAGLPPGCDVRGEGGFVIAPGSIGPKGRYRSTGADLVDWLGLIGPSGLPRWPEVLRPALLDQDAAPTAEPGEIPFATLREALLAIPNDGSNPDTESRDAWLNIGMALHYETGGSAEGLDLWQEWSGQWPRYDADRTEAAWQSFRRRDGALRTGQTILAEARKHGWRDLSAYDDAEIDPEADQTESRLTFLSPADCAVAEARRYVVKGMVAEGDVAAIVGAPGVGKSLFAPLLGYAVAQGQPVFGRKVRQGGVFYVAAEDESGMRARVAALREELGDAPDFNLVGGVTSLFGEDHKALRREVKARRPALVIIDTLAMAFPGLRENEAESMGLVVAAARALTKWGAAVVLIHHDTKDGAQGLPRGHSILNGALDLSLHLTKDGSIVRAHPTKNRNGTSDADLAFTIATRRMGEDEDGDEIRVAFARDLDPRDVEPREERLSPTAKAALAIWRQLEKGRGWVDESEWRAACAESPTVSGSEKPDSRRAAFRRALEELTRKGTFHCRDGKAYDYLPGRIDPNERFTDDDV